MKIPLATYRLQFNNSFTFDHAKKILDYLEELGISDVYASPIFRARQGSPHGYDITDSNEVNPELGGLNALLRFAKEARSRGVGLILDIVPNHMAFSPDNPILLDVLKKGSRSRFRNYFDIDWNHPSELRGKLLVPFLGRSYRAGLRSREFTIIYDGRLKVKYFGLEIPLSLNSYRLVFGSSIAALRSISNQSISDSGHEQLEDWLSELWTSNHKAATIIMKAINRFDRSIVLMDKLLASQNFTLAHWRTADRKVNYRRFFNIADLICVGMESKSVFQRAHRLILEFMKRTIATGLRIDHIDGLSEPEEYLFRLRRKVRDGYMVAEKILMGSERLPASWPIQGTTGYDYLAMLNGLFVAGDNERRMSRIYAKFSGMTQRFDAVLYASKKLILESHFAGDVDNLVHGLIKAVQGDPSPLPPSSWELRGALEELLAAFPFYRSYLNCSKSNRENVMLWIESIRLATKRNPGVKNVLAMVQGFWISLLTVKVSVLGFIGFKRSLDP